MPKEKWSTFRSLHAFQVREIQTGDLVRPWIGAGPFFIDLSREVPGRSFFEDLPSDTGVAVFRQCLSDGETCLKTARTEGDRLTFMGQTLPYEVIRTEDPLITWGRYHRGNTLSAMFLATRVVAPKTGSARFVMHVRIDNQVAVAVNGVVQYRSYEKEFIRTQASSWAAEQTLNFELNLKAGENLLTIGSFRLGRISSGGLYLETVDTPLQVSAPFLSLSDGVDRLSVETALDAFYPTREWFYPHETIRLSRDGHVTLDGELACEMVAHGKTVTNRTVALSTKDVVLGTGAEVENGAFEICTSVVVKGKKFGSRRFNSVCLTPTPALPGWHRFEERRIQALEHFSARNDMWAQVARYALGRSEDVDFAVIDDACDQMDRRLDCADFGAHPMLWLLHWDQKKNALSAQIKNRITTAFHNFRYWTDEPGSDCLVMGTENHQILFHVAEYLAGVFWPEEVFSNCNMTGKDHFEKGRALAINWLLNRGKTGFREWHSSSYYPHWMVAVLSLYDCAPESDVAIRTLSKNLLTVGYFNLANDSFEGILGTSHGRVYAPMLKVPDTDGCAGLNWLFYEAGHLGTHSTGVVPMAASSFRPPAFFADIAAVKDRVILTRHHQGNDANFIVYRTPDYMMSVLQDYLPGQKRPQVHTFQITFQDRIAIFFSCPETSREGGGHRPDYWSGNAYLPRAFGEKNVAMLLFQPGHVGWMSHGYFERDRFDEVREQEGWIFARKNRAYVGIWSENGYEIGANGPYAGRELICRAAENAWIIEAGREADWGTFEKFVMALCQTKPHRKNEQMVYSSPSIGTVQMGWDGSIVLNNKPIDTNYPLLDSPFGTSVYGSGKVRLHAGAEQVILTFGENSKG